MDMTDFRIVDLVSQRDAVRERVVGMPPQEVIAWLAVRGAVTWRQSPAGHEVFTFTSCVGITAAFTFVDGGLVLFGDHTTIP